MNVVPNTLSPSQCSQPMNKKRRLLSGDVPVALGTSSPSPVGSHHRLKHKNDSRGNSTAAAAAGDAILASMTNTHLRSPDQFVVTCTLTMLAKIFEEKLEYRSLACHELGTPFSIVHAMKTHANCSRIQYLGCQSLSFLCTTPGGNNDNSHVGGIEVVLSAMRQFANDTGIQVAACTYLGRLCSTLPKHVTEYLISMKGLGDVLSAMKNHANDSLVQGSACFAIKNLLDCQNKDNVPSFRIGNIQAVVQAMEQHSNNEELMSNACHILYYLAWHSDPDRRNEYRNIIINANGMGAVASIFRLFQSNQDLLLLASETMRAFLHPSQ